MNAPASSRPYDTVRVVLGLTAISVSVYTETTETDPMTKQFSPEGNPVGVRRVDKVTGAEVAFADLVSMHQTPNGPVAVSPSEIEDLLAVQPKTICIEAFYPLAQADVMFRPRAFRSIEPAQVRTSKGKTDDAVARLQLSVLLEAMGQAQVVAFGSFVTRGRPYPVVIFPDGLMWEVYFAEQIRERRANSLVEPPAELVAQMRTLVDSMTGTETPDLTDHRREAIRQYAAAKALAVNEPDQTTPRSTTDLIAALQASIDRQRRAKESAAA